MLRYRFLTLHIFTLHNYHVADLYVTDSRVTDLLRYVIRYRCFTSQICSRYIFLRLRTSRSHDLYITDFYATDFLRHICFALQIFYVH